MSLNDDDDTAEPPRRKGEVLGRPYEVLDDGTRLGRTGRVIAGQTTPTALAVQRQTAVRAAVRTVENPRAPDALLREFNPRKSAPTIRRTDPARAVGLMANFDNVKNGRSLGETDARTVCEALSTAQAVMQRLSYEADEDGDELGIVSDVLSERAERFGRLLQRIAAEPPKDMPRPPPGADPRWANLKG